MAPSTGPLSGLKVVELSHEASSWAGKLMADLGASTIVVEPPGGSAQRSYGPWLDDEPGPERSLWWWHYNTSKKSVVLDIDEDEGRRQFVELVRGADILLESEHPGRLTELGIDYADLASVNP